MKIATGVEMLQISTNSMGTPSTFFPTLIYDTNAVVLVDAGLPGQLAMIRDAIEKTGITMDQLNIIIITHHDIDHIGSLSSLLKELPEGVKVLSHKEEAPYIQGDKLPTKLTQMNAKMDTLPEDMKTFYEKLKAGFQNAYVHVNQTLVSGEVLPYCDGIEIVYTPGHTPGHICLYLHQSKTLIAGDLLSIEDGKLVKSPPHIHFDIDASEKSLRKLMNYDIENIICYHGGLFNHQSNQRIAELAIE